MKTNPHMKNSLFASLHDMLAFIQLISKRIVFPVAVGTGFLVLTSCVAPRYQIGTKNLPADRVAVLVDSKEVSSMGFTMGKIDGIGKGVGLVSEYYLLPGKHTVTAAEMQREGGAERFFLHGPEYSVAFVAAGGRKYYAKVVITGNGWIFEIRDVATNKLVSSRCATPEWRGVNWE